jgi:hypothetical protein
MHGPLRLHSLLGPRLDVIVERRTAGEMGIYTEPLRRWLRTRGEPPGSASVFQTRIRAV